jgi:hypothetical protein
VLAMSNWKVSARVRKISHKDDRCDPKHMNCMIKNSESPWHVASGCAKCQAKLTVEIVAGV